MQLHEGDEHDARFRAIPKPIVQTNRREWVCPECDYFEEADNDEADWKPD